LTKSYFDCMIGLSPAG